MVSVQATLPPDGGMFDRPSVSDAPPGSYAGTTLPGRGEIGDGCGESLALFCSSCGHSWVSESKCMRRTCPNCWRSWAAKLSRKEGLRMWAGSIAVVGRRRGFRIVHAVVSMHDSGEDIQVYRTRARITAKQHGLSGGLMIWHPYRQDEDRQFVQDGHVHFHVIGLARGDIKPGHSGSTVFKVIRDAKKKDYGGFRRCREIKACIFYLLTHAGIREGRHSVTWYGELSYNALSTGKLKDLFPDMFRDPPGTECPECGSLDIGSFYQDYMTGEEYIYKYNRSEYG